MLRAGDESDDDLRSHARDAGRRARTRRRRRAGRRRLRRRPGRGGDVRARRRGGDARRPVRGGAARARRASGPAAARARRCAEPVSARVARWLPIGPDGTGDIACCSSGAPLPARGADAAAAPGEGCGTTVPRARLPRGPRDGVWSTGRLRAGQGTGWVQLQATPADQPVVGGFSGSPVWDETSGAVVGMTVADGPSGTTTTAYLVPIDQVLGARPELLPCPYQGLAPFTRSTPRLLRPRRGHRAARRRRPPGAPLVALAGPSGAGKSSLLQRRAGAPAAPVRRSPRCARCPPGRRPVHRLRARRHRPGAGPRPVRGARGPRSGAARCAARGDRAADRPPAPVRAVLTVRGAALDDLLTPDLARVLDAGTLHVAPLDRANLRETIVRPAERAPGLDFEPRSRGPHPRRRRAGAGAAAAGGVAAGGSVAPARGRPVTWRGYTEAGGVVGAVAQHAEQVVAGLAGAAPEPGFPGSRCLDSCSPGWPRRTAPAGSSAVPLPLADLAPEVRSLVPRLAAGRLLVSAGTRAGRVVELAHQALIEHWPRLRDWLEQDRDFLAWRARADQQRDRWEAAGRDDGGLLRGSALVAAGEWLPRRTARSPRRPRLRRAAAGHGSAATSAAGGSSWRCSPCWRSPRVP